MAKTIVRLDDYLSPALLKAFRPKGFYVMDERECMTRRVDLGAPLDEDPGPIALGPVEEEDATEDAIILEFG